jgi:threonine/homoserine/homoserine lactone efflux protein
VPEHLVAFLGVVAVITVLPGPDMALGVRNGVRGGQRAAWLTGVGCLTGLVIWGVASVLGLAALLAASGRAFDVVRILGAVYLLVLGVGALRSALTGREGVGRVQFSAAPAVVPGAPAVAVVPDSVWFRQGLASNLLNPKIALLFLTLLPQFVGPHEARTTTTAELALSMFVVELAWWALFAAAIGVVGRALSRSSVRRAVEGVAGTLLVGLALRVAVNR